VESKFSKVESNGVKLSEMDVSSNSTSAAIYTSTLLPQPDLL